MTSIIYRIFFYINTPKIFIKMETKNHARKKGSKKMSVFTYFVAFIEKKYKDCTKLFNMNVKFSFLFRKIIVKAQFLISYDGLFNV